MINNKDSINCFLILHFNTVVIISLTHNYVKYRVFKLKNVDIIIILNIFYVKITKIKKSKTQEKWKEMIFTNA